MGVRGSAKRRSRRAPCSSAGANSKGESRFATISGGDDGNVLERKSKRRKTTAPSSAGPSGGAGADPDLISCLGDDVLVRVLEMIPDARDAVRTGALSRRWRGLWTRVPALRFASSARPEFTSSAAGGGAERYAAFVSAALALRAAQAEPAVERLAISFDQMMKCGENTKRLAALASPSSIVTAAEAWVQYAVDHALKSFDLERRLPINSRSGLPTMALDQLPSTAALETLRLAIGHAIVKLPETAVFASLTDLSLELMGVETGHLLARLLSSACCPRLRKLRLRKLSLGFQDEFLLLESGTLSDLSFEDMEEPVDLQLRTPNLRVLRIRHSLLNELVISDAPRLEILTIDGLPDGIDVDGDLPRVRRLQVVELRSHSYFHDFEDEEVNSVGIRLLQCCTSTRCLHVFLNVPKKIDQVSDVMKGRIPHLPNVTSLTVKISLLELHSFGDGVSDILAQCNNLKYLCLDLKYYIIADLQQKNPKLDLTCHHQDHWKTHEISLVHLKEVEFKGLRGTDCELWFMQSVISSARDLEKLAISFNREYQPRDRNEAFDLTSFVGDGVWTDCHGAYLSYEWRPF